MQIRGTQYKKQKQKLIQHTTATLIICEVNTTVGFLCRKLNISLSSLPKQAYKSLIIPSLVYACYVWYLSQKGQSTQNGPTHDYQIRHQQTTKHIYCWVNITTENLSLEVWYPVSVEKHYCNPQWWNALID